MSSGQGITRIRVRSADRLDVLEFGVLRASQLEVLDAEKRAREEEEAGVASTIHKAWVRVETDCPPEQLCLGGLQCTLGRLELCDRAVEILFAYRIHVREWPDPVQVAGSFGKPRPCLCESAFCLDDLRLERARVDDIQQLPLIDTASLEEMDLFQDAIHPCPDGDIDGPQRLADHVQVQRYVPRCRLEDGDLHRRHRGWFLATAAGQRNRCQHECGD